VSAGEERVRLFVALELPDAAREALVRWRQSALSEASGVAGGSGAPRLRLVRPEDLHATLCFLGSRRAAEIEPIGAACGVVAGEPPVESALGEPLWLPRRRPRVLAVSLRDAEGALARLHRSLSAALVAGGWYATESRPFLAHVTVARVGGDARLRPPELASPPADPIRCSRVTLYRSRLSPAGARYEPLTTVELGSAPAVGLGSAPAVGLGSAPGVGVGSAPEFELGSAPEAADPLSVVRRFYAEQARMYAGGGFDGVVALLTDDVVWHVPGQSAIAGEHRGVDAVLAYMDARRRMMDYSFRVTVHGAALIAGRVVQLAGGRAERDGVQVEWETVGVFRVAGGRIAECWLVPFDQAAFDRIWS
jgi:RNA 2',3'-cyclic 3'-phosphodiesterase